MKTRIYRVLSVALTVMLLTGLMLGLMVTPAAAQTGNQWTRWPTPVSGANGGWFMSPLITAEGPMDIAFDNSAIYTGAVFNGVAFILPDATDAFTITASAAASGTVYANTGAVTLTGTATITGAKWSATAGQTVIVTANTGVSNTGGYWTVTSGGATAASAAVTTDAVTTNVVLTNAAGANATMGSGTAVVYGNAVVHVLKSVKGSDTWMGRTWTMTNFSTSIGVVNANPIVDMVCSTIDANTVYVTDGFKVFWTHDGGTPWEALSPPPLVPFTAGTPTIECLDVGYVGTTPLIFVGTVGDTGSAGDDDVFVCQQAVFGMPWSALSIKTNRPGTALGTLNGVFDVKVSRTFSTDQMVAAVACTAGSTFLSLKYSGAQWGATVPDASLSGTAAIPTTLNRGVGAAIALRGTFDSQLTSGNMVYVIGLNGGTVGGRYTPPWDALAQFNGFWSNTGKASGTSNMTDIDVNSTTTQDGNISGKMTGTLPVYCRFAIDYGTSRQVWAVSNAGCIPAGSGPSPVEPAKTGYPALSFTTGSTSFVFNQISLIGSNIDVIEDVEPTSDWHFMLTKDTQLLTGMPSTNPDLFGQSLWRFDGKDWKRVYNETLTTSLAYLSDAIPSAAWQTDLTMMLADTSLTPFPSARLTVSTNGGESFTGFSVNPPNGSVKFIKVIDRNNWLLGSTGGNVFKETTAASSFPWRTYNVGSANNVVYIAQDPKLNTNILACTDGGEVFLSKDMGLTWSPLPAAGATVGGVGAVSAAFDPNYATNNTIYATAGAPPYGVYRLVGTANWDKISGIVGTWPQNQGAALSDTPVGSNVMVGSDGTLYTVDSANRPVSRCGNPTALIVPAKDAPYFEPLAMGWPTGDAAASLRITAGSNKLWTIDTAKAQVWTYTDQVTKPTLSSPADGTSSMRTDEVTLTWNAVTNATLYQVFVATDPGFSNLVLPALVQTSNTSARITGLEDGQTYYWRVAVFAQSPVLSLWSGTFDFTTELGAAQWNPFIGGVPESPANGATGVSRTPTFAWNAADWATGYEFQLGTDPTFATTLDSKTGSNAVTTTVYSPAVTLDYSTTYYWRVRAVAGATQSEYGTGVFTTEGAPQTPPPTPTPTPTPTPPPPPVTPTYIWVIIGIGAALVIAVIVLIIRTRRVA